MSIVNCPRCHRMFRRLGDRKICPGCQDQEEQAYAALCEWLQEHPGASVADASAATGVDEAMVLRLLRDGRVTLLELLRAEDQPTCRRCARPIAGGHMCPACARALGDALAGPLSEQPKQRASGSFRVDPHGRRE
ncbi:MAG: hypothetical protein VKQ33_06335 [Candidatus Sericytochromatia bacterium]|nr:hypothetical protein [Candidatus Sericytochromatia bacterium]